MWSLASLFINSSTGTGAMYDTDGCLMIFGMSFVCISPQKIPESGDQNSVNHKSATSWRLSPNTSN